MKARPLPHGDVVAHAMGALAPDEEVALEARRRDDPALDARLAEVAEHLRAYDALGAPPPPPPVARVLARLGPAPRSRSVVPLRVAVGVAAAAALAFVGLRSTGLPSDAPRLAVADASPGARLLRAGREVAWSEAAPGDVAVAEADASLVLGGRARVRLERGARLVLSSERQVTLDAGFAAFDVEPAADRPFRVRAGEVAVEVVGTRFGVERNTASASGGATGEALAFDVAVDVASGRVSANGVPVGAGEQVSFVGASATTPAAVARVPRLSLHAVFGPADESAGGAPADGPAGVAPAGASEGTVGVRAGEPVRLRLRLSNWTGLDLPLSPPGDPRAPYYVEVVDPAGAVVPVRVAREAVEGDFPDGLPPRASADVVLRFDSTFSRAGAYRLRTLFLGRPAGAFPPQGPDLEVLAR